MKMSPRQTTLMEEVGDNFNFKARNMFSTPKNAPIKGLNMQASSNR